ncbi:MAG: terpene cyclase/mutase family protein [bacterium]|nr:terpene cyclase/mutase family protein [bacterium]
MSTAQDAQETPQDGAIEQNKPFVSREQVSENLDRAVAFLISEQNEDGSWGSKGPQSVFEGGFALSTHASWQLAANALACSSLAGVKSPSKAEQAALEKSVRFLCTVPLPKRDSDWDIDIVWSAVYGFSTCVELLQLEAFQGKELQTLLDSRGREFLAVLLKHQALSGGWAYYDDPPFTRTPTWATSFTTAAVLPALVDAKKVLGWDIKDRVIQRAVRYVERCALPNGAYAYDLQPSSGVGGIEHINMVEGSLSRIQVCNWALARAGVKRITADRLREGLNEFFCYHKFLDHVRTRPIPHEGFHANAGYFYFFGHYYAARAIGLLPAPERAGWYQRLSPHLMKTQWKSGGASDFLRTPYMVAASTSFLIRGLQWDLDSRSTGKPSEPADTDSPTTTGEQDQ